MSQTLTRTGLIIPSADKSDPVHPVADLRMIGNWIEANAAMASGGLLAARPTVGKANRFYKPTDAGLEGVVYYDDGSVWRTIGGTQLVDPIAATPGLRTLGSGGQQAAPGNHGHARDIFDYATPGADSVGLTSFSTTVTAGPTTILAGPGSGRRIIKALLIDAPTPGTSVSLTLAGVTLCRLGFNSTGAGGDFALTLPIASGENLQATVTGGTVTFLASYVDRTDSLVDRFGLLTGSGGGTLVASSGVARTVTQILVANPSATVTAGATVTFAGVAILSGTPLPAGGLLTLDLPRPLPAGQAIAFAGDAVTACTYLVVGHA